jgi:cation:H+ antiporter
MIEFVPFEYLWIAFVVGVVLLVKGADLFVNAASVIARLSGLSSFVIGLTIVAIGTSAPEFAVSGYSALQGVGALALGNIIGSNIFNLGFILAICAIMRPISIEKAIVNRDCLILLIGAIVLSFAIYTGNIVTRIEGLILCTMLVGYVTYLLMYSNKPLEKDDNNKIEPEIPNLHLILGIVAGLSGLLLGCSLVVESSILYAKSFGVSEWLIGITIIAIGTSLPELTTAIVSVRKGDTELGVGGLVGSDIFNILGVAGLTAVLAPIEVTNLPYKSFALFITAIVLTAGVMRREWRVTKLSGIFLFFIAAIRYYFEIF